jgi:hypothetical protein
MDSLSWNIFHLIVNFRESLNFFRPFCPPLVLAVEFDYIKGHTCWTKIVIKISVQFGNPGQNGHFCPGTQVFSIITLMTQCLGKYLRRVCWYVLFGEENGKSDETWIDAEACLRLTRKLYPEKIFLNSLFFLFFGATLKSAGRM